MPHFFKLATCALLVSSSLVVHAKYKEEYLEFSKGWGSVVADFNADGHDDIFVCGHDSEDQVWYWTKNGYKPSAQVFEHVDRHDCDAADVDGDGRIDLFCAIGADKGVGTGPNELWKQGADGTFTKVANHGAEDPYGSGRIPVFMDFNHDGLPDLYVTNFPRIRDDGMPNISRMFINQGGMRFVEQVTQATGDRGAACAAKGDIDRDGWDDVLVCHEKHAGHIYINDRKGDFKEVFPPVMVGRWNAAKFHDMNGDGRDDLLLIRDKSLLEIWFNTGKAPWFERADVSEKLPGIATSLTVGEFGGDKRPDVYVTLKDADCDKTLDDKQPDIVFQSKKGGSGWERKMLKDQKYGGCGHLADTVDGNKVLLENGTIEDRGPNFVLDFSR
jgi:hypothetical protein